MKFTKLYAVGIAGAAVVAAMCLWPRGSHNFYSLNAYAGGYIGGPQWRLGLPPHWSLVISEYTDVGMPGEWGKHPAVTYTDIDFGSHRWAVRAHAWLVGAALSSAAAFAAFFLVNLIYPANSCGLPPARRR